MSSVQETFYAQTKYEDQIKRILVEEPHQHIWIPDWFRDVGFLWWRRMEVVGHRCKFCDMKYAKIEAY